MSDKILQVENLCKSYGSLKVVDNVSFEIAQGEILGLLGPNGAGKTTSISLITGMLPRDSGEIKFFGNRLNNQEDKKQNIGLCTQNLQIWPRMTCLEQIKFIGRLHDMSSELIRKRADYLLDCMKLTDKRNVLARKLSGGMKRRLHIIMSILHDPDIIILDEPEAGLDPQSRILIRDYILSLKDKKAILLTTHNMDEAERVADRVAIIDKGRLLEIDTPEKLKKKISPEDSIKVTFNNKVNLEKVMLDNKYRLIKEAGTITITGENIIHDISSLLETLINQVGKPDNLILRQSTLEDVFINLTGRSLRE